MRPLKYWLLILTCLLVASCAKSPTGRNTIKLFSTSQLNEMGSQAFTSLKEESTISTKAIQNDYVQCVANNIIAQVPKKTFPGEWEVVVFEDEQINAFALPGGKIGVYTGLLKVAENQHQLAAVIGHEVGHVIAEHGNERMSSNTIVGVGLEVTSQVLGAQQVAHNQQIMAAIGLGVQVGFQLPFSRTHESEADVIGLDLMAKAGFDPRQSVNLWENMDKASGGNSNLEFLSTHPSPTSRIKQLENNMNNANVLYRTAKVKPDCQKSGAK